jgi:DNA-binding LacI/PurR family transcriptional regulator/AcrR family transcriptional regulator
MSSERRPQARRERKKARTRHEIAEAAFALFADRGFDAVTVAEIAEAADVSAKTVYNHFTTKEQLFFESEPLLQGTPADLLRERPPGRPLADTLAALLAAPPNPPRKTATTPAIWAHLFESSTALRTYARTRFTTWEQPLIEPLTLTQAEHAGWARQAAHPTQTGYREQTGRPAQGGQVGQAEHSGQGTQSAHASQGGPGGTAGHSSQDAQAAHVSQGGLGGTAGHSSQDAQAAHASQGGTAGHAAQGVMALDVVAAVLVAAVRGAWERAVGVLAQGGSVGEAAAEGRLRLVASFAVLSPVLFPVSPAASLPPATPGPPPLPAGAGPYRGGGGHGERVLRVRGGERPSITRVAQLAGVSATTVSHTLNGRRPVADQTRRRVLDAIERLGYRPNVLARSLRTNRSHTVGLIIPDITNPFYPALARGLQDVLGPAGYDEIISNTDGDRRAERAAVEQMIARQVDGLAFAVFHTHAEDLLPAIEAGIPVVRLGGRQVQDGVDVVHSDDEGASAEATRHLTARGHRRIGFVCGPAAQGPAAERVAGYRAALAEAGIAPDPGLVVHTQFSRGGGAEGTATLLDLAEPPDAVLCANDIMAIGALDTAAARGLRVPGDLAVMGFDDIEAAGLISPGLTTMANPAREIGRACADLLLARLSGADATDQEVIIPARLVRRASA